MKLIKKLLRIIYYSIYDICKIFINFKKNYNYIIFFPRLISVLFKKIIIFDKKNKTFFLQNIRNYYDALTVHEIFAEEYYNINNFNIGRQVNIFFKNNIKNKNPLILDCGSNIGSSSTYFLKQFDKSSIILIEPDKNNFEFSKRNIRGENIHFLNQAISNLNQHIGFFNDEKDSRASRVSENSDYKIDCITVENILAKFDASKYFPFLIKLDIEGYENELFKNNYDWIDKFKVLIIETHDWMLPEKSNSLNFFNALVETMKTKNKRDNLIAGENLISIRIDE